MARNSRVGGVNSWRLPTSRDGVATYRPTRRESDRTPDSQSNVRVPSFADEYARYGWEVEQWRNAFLTKMRWTKWLGADEMWHVGPPVHPDAPLFWHKVAQRAFRAANEEGYVAPRHTAELVGISRYEAKRLMDVMHGDMRLAFVQYPHNRLNNTIWNCRMLHIDDVIDLGENLDEWRVKLKAAFKDRAIPLPNKSMRQKGLIWDYNGKGWESLRRRGD